MYISYVIYWNNFLAKLFCPRFFVLKLAKFGLCQINGSIFITIHVYSSVCFANYNTIARNILSHAKYETRRMDRLAIVGGERGVYKTRKTTFELCICTGAFPILASHYFTPVPRSPALTWIPGSYFNLPLRVYVFTSPFMYMLWHIFASDSVRSIPSV